MANGGGGGHIPSVELQCMVACFLVGSGGMHAPREITSLRIILVQSEVKLILAIILQM